MSRVRRTIGLVSAVALLMLGTALVGTASAANPGCGDSITSNTTLTADVGPCNFGDGLRVTASNITLDLNGHKVFSNAALPRMGQGGTATDVVGIYLAGVSNVTVRNGTVHNFSAGVVIDFGGSNRVTGITARDNQGPCVGEDFTSQAVGSFGDGIVMFSSANNRIEGNQAFRNSPFSGIAIAANTVLINNPLPPFPTGNVIKGNNIDDNALCFANIGIRVEGPAATNNLLQGNRINRSFQEGITVNAVNNTDFSGLFANPPTCQNRGFPNPALPQCPPKTGANVTPSNSNNTILNNQVTNSGFGGPQNPPRGGVSNESAVGLNLLAFCPSDARNGSGNLVRGNLSTDNAGSGIAAGGCQTPGTPGASGTTGWTNNKFLNNVALRNNGRNCGVLPAGPGCGGRPTVARPDLLDSNNVITCPSTTATVQGICASLGFPAPPPAPTQFIGTRVVLAGGPVPGPCDSNQWIGNRFGTAFPTCTTATAAAQASQVPASAGEGSGGAPDPAQERARPLRPPNPRH